ELGRRGDWANDGHVDVRSGHFGSQTLRHTNLRELGGRVRAHIGNAALAGNGGDDHHVPATLPPEHGERGASGVEGAEVVDVHQLPHLIGADVVDGAINAEAGVTHY